MASPLDYQIDALLRTLHACERTQSDVHCALYISQLARFTASDGRLLPSASAARKLSERSRHYELIGARTCKQIGFERDRALLKQAYGPSGTIRRLLRRCLSV